MFLDIFLFIVGLVALLGGAKLLVSGASQVAFRLGIPTLIIAFTIVSFGTSAPEIFIGGLAAWRGKGEIVIGNVVGSNIFNILLVIGVGATLSPLQVKKLLIRWGVPWMIAVSLIFWALTWGGRIFRYEGVILLIGLLAYLYFSFRIGQKESEKIKPTPSQKSIGFQFLWIVLAIILLTFGSDLLIDSSVKLAQAFGVSELFIGLLMIAGGTSLPELATAIMAVSKKEYDIVAGSAVGSNVFNILGVMGISSLIAPTPILVPLPAVVFDIPVMVACGVATLPIFITGHKISRWEGILFLFYYLLYVTYLVMRAKGYVIFPLFTSAFFFFILPLTLITLTITFFRHVYRNY